MLVCRRGRTDADPRDSSPAPEQGGPVFLPRRQLSPLAEALLADRPLAIDLVTPRDDQGLGGAGLPGRAASGRPRS